MWIRSTAIVCSGVALVSCSGVSLSDEVQAARAVVTGPANRVFEFNKDLQASLKSIVGDTDPAKIGVVCDLFKRAPQENSIATCFGVSQATQRKSSIPFTGTTSD